MNFIPNQHKKRFTIQQHFLTNNKYHFDLMFEENNVLKTFQIEDIQKLLDGIKIACKNIQDHRLIYLDYEGEISGNRGYVKIFDKGYYYINKKTADFLEFNVESNNLNGILHITHTDVQKKISEIFYVPLQK